VWWYNQNAAIAMTAAMMRTFACFSM
jgi:hypothetical protein